MRVFNMLLAAGVVPLLIGACAQNRPAQPALAVHKPAVQKPVVATMAGTEMVCKQFPPATGSRLRPRQICKTQIEWNLIRQDEQEVLERVQIKPSR